MTRQDTEENDKKSNLPFHSDLDYLESCNAYLIAALQLAEIRREEASSRVYRGNNYNELEQRKRRYVVRNFSLSLLFLSLNAIPIELNLTTDYAGSTTYRQQQA